MDLLYLSSLCTVKEYQRMFKKYGTTSSHAAQKYHRLMTQGLKSHGLNITMWSYRTISVPDNDDMRKETEQENGMIFHYVPHIRNPKLNRLYTIIKTYSFLKKWKKTHKKMYVISDTINGEFSIALFLFRLFHKCTTTGLVLDVPAIRANDNRTGIKAIPIKIKNWLIYKYDSYVFLTEQMNAVLNPKHKPYTVVEGIVDNSVFDKPNKLENKQAEKVIMMAGLLEKDFGVDDLLEAFIENNDKNSRLYFYGRGKSVDLIEQYSKKDSRIKFFGELENSLIMEEERKATFLINPRTPKGEWTAYSFPSKNIEYISSGTPLVAYDLPCIPAEYKDHFIIIKDIKITIKEILSMDRSLVHVFGLNAQKWIVENKNANKQTECVADMITKMQEEKNV